MMNPTARTTTTPRRRCYGAAVRRVVAVLVATLLVTILPRPAEGFQGCSVPAKSWSRQQQMVPSSALYLNKASASLSAPSSQGEMIMETRGGGGTAPFQRAIATAAWMTTAVMIPAASAWAAAGASEGDEYVYGAVDAPIGLAVGAGILAIATAALPVLLKGGEQAFEEIRERDEGTFGSPDKNKDVLKSRRK